jgi:hypothetical protein
VPRQFITRHKDFGEFVAAVLLTQVSEYEGLRADMNNLVLVFVAEIIDPNKDQHQGQGSGGQGEIVVLEIIGNGTR